MIILNNKIYFLLFLFLIIPYPSFSEQILQLSLTQFVDLSLNVSGKAYSLADNTIFSDMNVSTAQHQFSPQLIPLASIGYNSINSNQTLGLKLVKKIQTGQEISVGISAHLLDSDEYVVTNSHSVRSYVQVSQPLFRKWGKRYNRNTLTRAEKLKQKQSFLAYRTKEELILTSIQKYYAVVLAEIQCDKTKMALQRAQEYLDIARSRFSTNLVSKADVYRAELALLEAENSWLDQQRSRNRTRDDLREHVNWNLDDRFSLNKDIQLLVPVIPETYDDTLLTNHPDWQAKRIDVELQRLTLYLARRDLLPDISLNLQAEKNGQGNSFAAAKDLDETNWSLSLQLNSTFDRFNERSTLIREKMVEAKLHRESESLKRRIRRNVHQALDDLRAEERRQNISTESLHQAKKALDLELIRYERGLSDNLGLMEAESNYTAAEMGITESRIAYNLAAVRLGKALGVLDMEWLQLSMNP